MRVEKNNIINKYNNINILINKYCCYCLIKIKIKIGFKCI